MYVLGSHSNLLVLFASLVCVYACICFGWQGEEALGEGEVEREKSELLE